MVYTKLVEIGRVALISNGPDNGKLCAIIDVIDANRALIDGPCSGVKRGAIQFKNLLLTKWVLPIRHSARQRSVRNAWTTAKISEQFAESPMSKKLKMHELRIKLTDFDRFRLMKAKKMRNQIVNKEFSKLKKAHNKSAPKTAKPKPKSAKPAAAKPAAAKPAEKAPPSAKGVKK